MAGGWARDGAVQDQIDASVEDEVQRARASMRAGPSRTECAECGEPIPEARRRAVPGVRLCIQCQAEQDGARPSPHGPNRRGSKDSQLR